MGITSPQMALNCGGWTTGADQGKRDKEITALIQFIFIVFFLFFKIIWEKCWSKSHQNKVRLNCVDRWAVTGRHLHKHACVLTKRHLNLIVRNQFYFRKQVFRIHNEAKKKKDSFLLFSEIDFRGFFRVTCVVTHMLLTEDWSISMWQRQLSTCIPFWEGSV